MNVYRREVMICATAYIKASSPEAADKTLRGIEIKGLEVTGWRGDVPISGAMFTDPALPKISLSPSMTIHGHWPGSTMEEAE